MVANALAITPAIRAAWAPFERLTVSAWSDKHRQLHRGYSAAPGQWRTDRTPYLKEIMDTFTDSRYSTIVIPKSAQIGLTESANNMLCYLIAQDPGPTMFVYPTQDDVKSVVHQRLEPAIEGIEVLKDRNLIPPPGWATNNELNLRHMTIYMAAAASPRTLTSKPIRYLFIDELDNCESQVGSLGNTLSVASERLTTFNNDRRSKRAIYSTPTTVEGSCWRLWLKSDMRHYFVPCPLCGQYQRLFFDHLKVPDGMRDHDAILMDDLAWYECGTCHGHLTDARHKEWMTARGIWLKYGQEIMERLPISNHKTVDLAASSAPNRWMPQIGGLAKRTRTAGFHIWSAYSPWRKWSEIVAKFFESKDDRDEFRVFVNSWLGEPWEEVASTVKPETVRERIGAYPRYIVPPEAQVLTAGVDLQYIHRRLYYEVRAWGPHCESWLVDHGFYACNTDKETIMEVLARFYAAKFTDTPYQRVGGEKVGPRIVMIDSGGEVARQVYEFCKTHLGAFACKGESSNLSHCVRPANPEPRRSRTDTPHPLSPRRLWLVNADKCKDALYSFAMSEGDGPSTMHLHAEVDDEWVNQFTAEHQVYDPTKKRLVWKVKSSGRANHYLDAAVLAMAGAEVIGALSLKEQVPVIRNPKDKTTARRTHRDVLRQYSDAMI